MNIPPLLGRRIHISGSIAKDAAVATPEAVGLSREFVEKLVIDLLKDGAMFVVPVDRESVRDDDLPICFDWLVLETIANNLHVRPAKAAQDGRHLIVAVQHYKNESQIPDKYRSLWERLKATDGLMSIENAGRWNMNSKRMEVQSRFGDLLIVLGGDEGVCYLANLYRDAGKPVIPLNFEITGESRGARSLWEQALDGDEAESFFRTADGTRAHNQLNRLNFAECIAVERRVEVLLQVIRTIEKPIVFAVRLLNADHPDYHAVENFFAAVVAPVVADLGYKLKTMDGKKNDDPFISSEIFTNLHFSRAVVADLTGLRPNCFIELGYALGRSLPTMMCARKGEALPFDISPMPGHFWNPDLTVPQQQEEFRTYWKANIDRRPIVQQKTWKP